ncbi:hypothetical protein PSPO01_11695 [Paraphaeosphaeria sporulosa]
MSGRAIGGAYVNATVGFHGSGSTNERMGISGGGACSTKMKTRRVLCFVPLLREAFAQGSGGGSGFPWRLVSRRENGDADGARAREGQGRRRAGLLAEEAELFEEEEAPSAASRPRIRGGSVR